MLIISNFLGIELKIRLYYRFCGEELKENKGALTINDQVVPKFY
jgi:hypothetical protein